MKSRVYILSSDDALASVSDHGPGWENMWSDSEGRRLLPFVYPPDGHATLTVAEAIAYRESEEAKNA